MNREYYIKKLEDQLGEWQKDLQELRVKIDQADDELREEYKEQLEQLRKKREEMRLKLEGLRDTGEDAWEDVKAGVELSWEVLSESFKDAIKKFK